jgi:hypothetical protein
VIISLRNKQSKTALKKIEKQSQGQNTNMEILLSLLEVSGLGASIYLFLNLQRRQIKVLDLLQFLKKSTVFSPELLLKVLQKSAPAAYT